MNEQSVATLDRLVHDALKSTYAAYGATLTPLAQEVLASTPDHDVACSLGFVGADMRGAFLKTTRGALVRSVWPKELSAREPTENDLGDWLGELTNQVIGKVKNALAARGLPVQQGTPTVIHGLQLHRSPPQTTLARAYAFQSEDSTLFLYLDAALLNDLTIPEEPIGDGAMNEGEVALF